MKKRIKIIILVFVVCLVLGCVLYIMNGKNTFGKLYKDGKIEIGDIVNYTSSKDKSIKWQVIGEDKDGNIMLLSNKTAKVDFGWGTGIDNYYSKEKGEEFYLDFANKANEISKTYADGTGAISGHALNLEEVAKLCDVKLVEKNSEQEITGTFPKEGQTTKNVIDNYNEFLVNKGTIDEKVYNMLFSIGYYNLASTGINIYDGVAYFNTYAVLGKGIQGMEKYSTNNGEISKTATVYVNYLDYSRDFRPVVVVDSKTKLSESEDGVWNIK